jgi:hypothetical protein
MSYLGLLQYLFSLTCAGTENNSRDDHEASHYFQLTVLVPCLLSFDG